MTREETSVLENEKRSHAQGRVGSEGALVGTEQEIATDIRALLFCLRELFALNCHVNLLIEVKGDEEGKEELSSLEDPLYPRHYVRKHQAMIFGVNGRARRSLRIL